MSLDHVLSGHPVLQRLSSDDRKLAAHISRQMLLPRNRLLYREGAPASGVYLVIDGFVKLLKTGPAGRELLVGLAGPDDVFGLCCQPMVACAAGCTAQARPKTKVALIPSADWLDLLERRPSIAHKYIEAMMASRRACTSLAADLAFLSTERRLARVLLTLARWGREEPDGCLSLPRVLSQWEIASAAGTSRVVVTRKLAKLVQDGLLQRDGRRILIRHRSGLERLAATG